jgi:DNA-binding MarR family transcriptional regulator
MWRVGEQKRSLAKPQQGASKGELSLLFFLYKAEKAAEALVDETLAPGIADGYAAMSLIKLRGPQTPTALAQQLGMLLSTTSALIQRLVKRGHVVQEPNPQDGRSYLVALTPLGDAEHQTAVPVFSRLMMDIQAELEHPPAEVAAMLQDLERAIQLVRAKRLGS